MREIEGVMLYTIPETAERLGVTAQTVRRYIKGGVLKARRVGRPYLISSDSLKRFVSGGSGEPTIQANSNGTHSRAINGLLP